MARVIKRKSISFTCSILFIKIIIGAIFILLPIQSTAQQSSGGSTQIMWRDYSFDTSKKAALASKELTLDQEQALQAGYYFLQFTGPITKAMKQQVIDAGVTLLNYVPHNAYLVQMDPATRTQVEEFLTVRWVGIYQPAMRLSKRLKERMELPVRTPIPSPEDKLRLQRLGVPATTEDTQISLTIILFKDAEIEPIKSTVRSAGGQILFAREGKRRSKLRVVISRDKLSELARMNGVMWIEEFVPEQLHNDISRGVLEITPVWTAHGLQGNGQIIAVADTGLDSGLNDASMHDDFEGRINNIFSWPVQNKSFLCSTGICVPGNVSADDGASDLNSGHGTHTTGSAVGNGTLSAGIFSGVAPQANLVFQAIEQFVDLPGTDDDGYKLGGIPVDYKDLYQQAYDVGARIHTSSWGGPADGEYTGHSYEVDEFVWDHPDLLILRTAGNEGEDTNTDSVIDTGSLGSPGSAKNALTVGSTENNRIAIPLTYSWNYGAGINADRIANNTEGMAAFSSRGPANADTLVLADDRIKPDLVAPGTMVVSTRSQFTADTIWFNDDMEAGLNGWAAGGTWAQIVTDSHSANTSWHDSPAGNYPDNANISLTSPIQNLTGGGLGAKAIQFWAHFDLGAGDQVRLEVSDDGGASWIGISITGQQADWELLTVGMGGLPDYYNSTNFRLRFRLISDNDGNTGDGFFVDDVRIVEGAFSAARLSDLGLAAAGSANDQNYLLMNGTSMSSPLIAGAAALVRQYYTQELGLSYVSAALLRATLMNGATDISPGQYGIGATREIQESPNNVEGWGRVNLENSLYPVAPAVLDHMDELAGLEVGETHEYQLNVTDAGAPIVVTMVYHDFPGAALVNNLNMTLLPPAGTAGLTAYPNGLITTDDQNNVEQIVIAAPVVGTYTIRIQGQSVPQGPQPYALVTSAGGTLTKRDPVDVALALDLSGSMLSPACPTCDPKLDVLKDAVELFVALWTALTVPDDRVGLNYFRTMIDEFEVGGTYLLPVLSNASALVTDVRSHTTNFSNLTAMGGSLQTAIGRLTDATRPRNIILFTDGMQNVNPMVLDTDPSAAGVSLVIDDEAGRTSSGISPTTPPTVLDGALDIKVNTIGVGATPAFTDLLEDIADETDGVSKLTLAPDEDLRRFYVEELVDALRHHSPQLLDYRHDNLNGSGKTETFTVNRSARRVLLKLSWKRGEKVTFRTERDGLDLSQYGHVISSDFYRIHVFDTPFSVEDQVIKAEGDWRMHISGSSGVRYEAAVIVDEADLDYVFSIAGEGQIAGDPLELLVELKADGGPIIDARQVTAKVLKPQHGLGNLLSVTPMPAQSVAEVSISTVSSNWESSEATPGQRKLLLLQQDENFFNKMQPVSQSVTLSHQGGGRYSGLFADTLRPGIYTVIFTVEGEHPNLGQYQRTEMRSKLIRFGEADYDASAIALRFLDDPIGEWNAVLSLRPKDRHGNYLGPDYGHMIALDISVPGVASKERRDLADGSYEIPLQIPVGADPTISIQVMDKPLYSGPVSQLAATSRYSLSLHYGYSIPTGSFDNIYDGDHSLTLDLGYRLSPRLSLVGLLGYHSFDSSQLGVDDTHWWNISANLRYEAQSKPWKPYLQGGVGAYIPEHGSTEPGINIGAGVEYQIDNRWNLDFGLQYHHVLSGGSDPEFLLPSIGVIYRY